MKTEKTSYRVEKGLRVFRTSYRDGDGDKQMSGNWWVEFRDHGRIIRRLPGFSDKQTTIDLAKHVKGLVGWRVSGCLPNPDLERWIEAMPADLSEIEAG